MPEESLSIHDVRDIHALSADIPKLMETVPEVGRQILRSSLSRLHVEGVNARNTFQLGQVTLHWQVYVTKKEQKVVFFFFKKDVPTEVYLDIDLDILVSPTDKLSPLLTHLEPAQPNTDRVRYVWFPPAFVFVKPPADVLGRLGMTMGDVTDDYAIILSLREDQSYVMAARLEDEKNVSFVFEASGVREEVPAREVSVQRLLDLYTAVRSWIRGDIGSIGPIEVDTTPDNDLKDVLNTLFQLFIATNNTLVFNEHQGQRIAPTGAASIFDQFVPFYMLSHFNGHVLLRLKEDGNFAVSHADKPFQLRVDIEAKWTEPEPELQIHVVPPDFLVQGELFDVFLQELKKREDELLTELNATKKDLSNAIANAPSHGAVFRVERNGSIDTDLFILPVGEKVNQRAFIFSGEFEIEKQETWSIKTRGPITNRISEQGQPDPMVITYFIRLLTYMRKWGDMIA